VSITVNFVVWQFKMTSKHAATLVRQ